MGVRKKNNQVMAVKRKEAQKKRAIKKLKREAKGKTAGQKLAEKMASK